MTVRAAADASFRELVAGPDEELDLAHAALAIARGEYPDLDVAAYMKRIESLADRVRGREGGAVEGVRGLLFDELGFHGNTDDYYDPRNSFLNDVIDRRTGIPISLSTLFLEVARRAGVRAFGVGLPGHFIVRVDDGESTLLDPYNGGVRLSESDCQQRLDRIYGGRIVVEPQMLSPVTRKHVLARTLRNLKAIYLKGRDGTRALRTTDLLLDLNPYSAEDLRDRGLIYAALDCYALAVRDLERYLEIVPEAPENHRVRETLERVTRSARHVS